MADTITIGTKQSGDELTAGEVNQIVTKTNAAIVELNQKVAAVNGKGLSTEDYTTGEKQKLSRLNEFNKGFFANEAAIIAAYPAGSAGWFVINGETDTVWLWDVEGNAWKNSGSSAANVGGGGIVEKTREQLVALVNDNALTPGQTYKITDRGDRGIILQAIAANKLASEGIRIMLCPYNYSVTNDLHGNNWIGVWNSTKTALVDDLTIWNGQVWKCIVEVSGPLDAPDINAVNWVLVSKTDFTNHEYTELIFGCIYDFDNDWIAKQWDGKGNVFGLDYEMENNPEYGYYYGFNICDYSDWNFATTGYKFNKNNCQGIYNNSTTGGIFENTNIGMIFNNSNSGEISKNSNKGSIFSNSNKGSNGIFNNTNNGDISDNANSGDIYENSNNGDITTNSNNGSINGNSNLDRIYNNSNSGNISSNSNNGSIAGCTNNQGVTVNIKNNINNGNISGWWPYDVTDDEINKQYSTT